LLIKQTKPLGQLLLSVELSLILLNEEGILNSYTFLFQYSLPYSRPVTTPDEIRHVFVAFNFSHAWANSRVFSVVGLQGYYKVAFLYVLSIHKTSLKLEEHIWLPLVWKQKKGLFYKCSYFSWPGFISLFSS